MRDANARASGERVAVGAEEGGAGAGWEAEEEELVGGGEVIVDDVSLCKDERGVDQGVFEIIRR
jgi:hypothetical protein